jgi:hypothetical protein
MTVEEKKEEKFDKKVDTDIAINMLRDRLEQDFSLKERVGSLWLIFTLLSYLESKDLLVDYLLWITKSGWYSDP